MSDGKYTTEFLKLAHKSSLGSKSEVIKGDLCGCFYCMKVFSPKEITEWIIENDNHSETAMCPYCDIDTILSSKWPIDDLVFLKQMNLKFF